MEKIEKQMKLAKEVVELIHEYVTVAQVVRENFFTEIKVNADGSSIEVNDIEEGLVEYPLDEISTIFSGEMRGWGPCGPAFDEAISLAESELEYEFKKLSEKDFKEYVGNLKYAEYRCEEIYVRLEAIESEAENL